MSLTETLKSVLRPAYYRLPGTLKYGREFARTVALLSESEHWSEDRLAEYQVTKLREMLRHCSRNVPYYRKLFRRFGLDPEAVRSVDDLRQFPTLDRDTIRANLTDLVADNISRRRMIYSTTGGTSGKPLGVYYLRPAGGRERAFVYTAWKRGGFDYTCERAVLMGWVVRNRRHWEFNPLENAYILSNFHMTPDNVAKYHSLIKEKKLRYLHSYPSAIIDFARHLRQLGLEPPSFHAIFGASENLYSGQREFIEGFYGTRLFAHYGHTECTVLAAACEVSNYYHVFPEYGVTEVIKEDGSPAQEQGEIGELVGTSLYNLAMPLIRYRTDDWAKVGPRRCECGRNYKLLSETRGRRRQEMLVGKLDNLISVTALNFHSDLFDRVHQLQFYQKEKGKMELRLRRRSDYTDRDSAKILSALKEKMGDTMDITLSFPDEIPLLPRGKFRLVIREIELPVSSSSEVNPEPVSF